LVSNEKGSAKAAKKTKMKSKKTKAKKDEVYVKRVREHASEVAPSVRSGLRSASGQQRT